MILKDFINEFIEPNTLIRLQYKVNDGHIEVMPDSNPVMEWEIKNTAFAEKKVIGVTDILYLQHKEAVNIVIEV